MSAHSKHKKWFIKQLWHWLNPTITFLIPLSPFPPHSVALVIIFKKFVFHLRLFSVRKTHGNSQLLDKMYSIILSSPPLPPPPHPSPSLFQFLCLLLSTCHFAHVFSTISHRNEATSFHKHFTLDLCSVLHLHTKILMPNIRCSMTHFLAQTGSSGKKRTAEQGSTQFLPEFLLSVLPFRLWEMFRSFWVHSNQEQQEGDPITIRSFLCSDAMLMNLGFSPPSDSTPTIPLSSPMDPPSIHFPFPHASLQVRSEEKETMHAFVSLQTCSYQQAWLWVDGSRSA